jgi:hypothetical protein
MFPSLGFNEYVEFSDGKVIICNAKNRRRMIWMKGVADKVNFSRLDEFRGLRRPDRASDDESSGQMQAEMPIAA